MICQQLSLRQSGEEISPLPRLIYFSYMSSDNIIFSSSVVFHLTQVCFCFLLTLEHLLLVLILFVVALGWVWWYFCFALFLDRTRME